MSDWQNGTNSATEKCLAIAAAKIMSGVGVELFLHFFFFQAEDGIRDLTVTGVQTCALPIYGGHIKLWSHKTLSQLLKEGGFRLVRFIGAGRIPLLWKSMIMVAQKPEEPGQ